MSDAESFHSLFEFLPIGAYRSSPDGALLRANPALVRMNGYASEAALLAAGHDLARDWYVQPQRRAAFLAQLERRGQVTAFVSEVRRLAGGERLWVRETAHQVMDAQGRCRYIEGTIEDISEQQRSRSDFEQISDQLPGLVFRLLASPPAPLRWRYASAGAQALFGLAPHELLADVTAWRRLWHPDDCASTDAAWQAAASQQRPLSLEHRIQLPGGELKWVLLRAAPVRQTPDGLEFAGVMLDVSARRQAEARLTEANQRWKLALESVGDGVWDWDLVGGRELYSDSFLAMYGYRAEDLADDPDILDQLTHPDDVPGMRRDREAHFSGVAPRYLNEHRVRCRDGQWKWVLSRGLVIERDAAGRPLRMIGTHTDITARRQADALRAERDRADAAKQAMGRLLSRVSHELRTPLNAVLGFAQLLEREPGLAATPRAWTRHILLAGQHLLALVDDVLDLGSAQEGQLPLALQPLCARTAFDEAWAMVLAAEGTPQQVTVPVVGEAWVQADPQRLRQILANLLGNAVKFNRPGGQVLRRVRVAGDWVVLEVQDEGAGVAPAALGRLFSPFERLDAARRGIPGTGLGLALSRQLAQAMGGELDVRSPSGEGACFRLHLPAAPAQVATRLRPADLAR